jgi:hypothetical protein
MFYCCHLSNSTFDSYHPDAHVYACQLISTKLIPKFLKINLDTVI